MLPSFKGCGKLKGGLMSPASQGQGEDIVAFSAMLVRLGASKVSKTSLVVQNIASTQKTPGPQENWKSCVRGLACDC